MRRLDADVRLPFPGRVLTARRDASADSIVRLSALGLGLGFACLVIYALVSLATTFART